MMLNADCKGICYNYLVITNRKAYIVPCPPLSMDNQRYRAVIVVLVAMLTVLLAMLISITFKFEIIANLVMSWILTSFFSIFVILLVEPRIIEQVQVDHPVYVDRPIEVIKEVPIQIPIENKTIEVVESTPIIRNVIKYVETPRRKLNIPKFKFIASSQARTFHSRNCRLGKLIKKKYKVHSNFKDFFKRKHFKGCKVCITKQKKV